MGWKVQIVTDCTFLGSKITVGGDCGHEIKRCLPFGRKAMANLDKVLKSKDITLPTKVHIGKAMIFPVVMYRCESWIIKKAERWRIDAFKLWCWRRLLTVPWTARSNQSILKEINPEYSLERLMLKLKLQYFGHLMGRADSLEKTWCWKRLRAEEGDRGWDSWMASLTQRTWVWANSVRMKGREARHAAVHGVARNRTQLSNWTPIESYVTNWTLYLKWKAEWLYG